MPGTVEAPPPRTAARERVGRALMAVAALAAAVSAVGALLEAADGADTTRVLEVWRGYGLVVFAGLFGVLALWPRQCPALWELVIVNELALAITGAVLLADDVPDAESLALGDGVLCVVLVAAYVCCRGWTASTTQLARRGR
jgi:hypothetical protein